MSHVNQRLLSWPPGHAESTPGQRTNFSVCLPRFETAADELSPTLTFKPGHGHVLCVDDEDSLVEMGKEVFEMLGYQVTCCASSLDALETFRAKPEHYDAVITD